MNDTQVNSTGLFGGSSLYGFLVYRNSFYIFQLKSRIKNSIVANTDLMHLQTEKDWGNETFAEHIDMMTDIKSIISLFLIVFLYRIYYT